MTTEVATETEPLVLALLSQIYRRWRLHPRHRLSKARAHRSRLRHLPGAGLQR